MTVPDRDRLSPLGRFLALLIALIGVAAGLAGGLWAGMMAWCWGYYLIAMAPRGTPFRAIDQAAMPGLFAGLVVAFIGGPLVGRLFWRLGVALAKRLER